MTMINFKEIFVKGKDKNAFSDILGQEKAKRDLMSALLAKRHVIIYGPPGIGKTTLARNLAKMLPDIEVSDCSYHCDPSHPICPECRLKMQKKEKLKTKKISGKDRFVRVQGSPDLSAEDLIGDIDPIKALTFGPLSIEAFTPGKIFRANNGILFFDELNRCPEKLQNALLQVLEEGIATIGSYDIDIEANFIFIATMNPKDSSTEKLSDVLLDRLDVIYMDYPETLEIEKKIVAEKGEKIINFPDVMMIAMVEFIRRLRHSKKVEKMPSVRATIGVYERAQGNAYLAGKKEVQFEDIVEALLSVLAHRIKLKPSAEFLESTSDFVKEELREFAKDKQLDKGDSL